MLVVERGIGYFLFCPYGICANPAPPPRCSDLPIRILHTPTPTQQQKQVLFAPADLPFAPGDPQSYDAWSIGVVFLELILGTPHVFTISSRDRNILAHQVSSAVVWCGWVMVGCDRRCFCLFFKQTNETQSDMHVSIAASGAGECAAEGLPAGGVGRFLRGDRWG